MNDLSLVMKRIAAGDRARFFHNDYGQHLIELSRGWIFKRRIRVSLLPDEIIRAKDALRARRQRKALAA